MRKPTALFSFLLIPAAAALLFALPSHSSKPDAPSAAPSRTFSVSYQVHVPAAKDTSGKRLLCLPLPQQDGCQQSKYLRIAADVAHSEGQDPEYGNPYALFQP